MPKPKVIRLSIDAENPLHDRVSQWLSQFELKQGRRSRRSSYHFLAAMMLYIDVKEGRARVIPVGGGPSPEEVISRVMFGDASLAGSISEFIADDVATVGRKGVPSLSSNGESIGVDDEDADLSNSVSPVSDRGVSSESGSTAPPHVTVRGSSPVLKRSIIGDVGFGGADDY